MFADKLSPEQRQVVFDLAVNLANADNELCKEDPSFGRVVQVNFSATLLST